MPYMRNIFDRYFAPVSNARVHTLALLLLSTFLIAIAFLLAVALSACSTTQASVKSVDEAARVACEAAFAIEGEPHEETVEQFCKTREDLKPFIDAIKDAEVKVRTNRTLKKE